MRSERERRARLASMRQELLAPATALVGYGELLRDQAQRLRLVDIVPDVGRVHEAAHDLLGLVNRLLDGAAGTGLSRVEIDAIQVKIRHDLRNR